MLLRTFLSMGPPLLRFSWVLHTQARASDVSNHLLSHHSLPRMTTSWDPYSCSKTLCNEGHSPSCSQRHWTNTSAPWSALVLILHTNSWDRNTFSTLEEFSAEDFLQNLESRGSVSDCQLALLPPLERDEVKPEFVSEACPSLHVAALWKAPLLELTQQCTVLCLRVPDSLPPSRADPEESGSQRTWAKCPPSSGGLPSQRACFSSSGGKKECYAEQLECIVTRLGEAAPNTCRIGQNYQAWCHQMTQTAHIFCFQR